MKKVWKKAGTTICGTEIMDCIKILESAEAKEDREDEEARLWTVGGNYLEV